MLYLGTGHTISFEISMCVALDDHAVKTNEN